MGLIGQSYNSYESHKSYKSYSSFHHSMLMIVLSHVIKAKIRIEPGVSQSISPIGMKFE